MPNHEDAQCLADDSKEKMVRKSMEINAANVALGNGAALRILSGVYDALPKLTVKILSKRTIPDSLVIAHDGLNVRIDAPMKDDPLHQRRS